MRKAALLVCLVIVALITGCGPRWQVVKQATPNPMAAPGKFRIVKPSFEGLMVGGKPEAEWQGSKEAEQKGNWQADKEAFGEEFTNAYNASKGGVGVASAPAEGFTIKPLVTWYEPGFYAVAAARPTEVKMTIQILDPSGGVLDEITVQSSVPATLTNPSSGGRLRDAGKDLGDVVAKYVKQRNGVD